MKSFIPPGKSLKFYTLLSWAVPGTIATISCLFVFFASAGFEYRTEVRRLDNDLASKAYSVARALSGEVLIGNRGAVKSVAENLKKDFDLSSIDISHENPSCLQQAADNACGEMFNRKITRYHRLPSMDEAIYAVVSIPVPSFWTFMRIKTLLWSTIPIALMFAIGLFFQRFILRRYILKPVQALIDTSTGNIEPEQFWPEEIKDISHRLYRSFEVRDEEVFSQIARGVIHDLRTLIHSPMAAVELVAEAAEDKRAKRLENLLSVTSQQLPKMKEIIDNTLDGSREISVNKTLTPVRLAIDDAIKTLEPFIQKVGVNIQVSGYDALISHDNIQVERAITNLVKNAIEACQEKGSANATIAITTSIESGSAQIRVEDSGAGLKVPQGKLFRPLKSTKAHGSGLGLIVTRKIIEAHGGSLVVGSSHSLGGAQFTINLPMNQEGIV